MEVISMKLVKEAPTGEEKLVKFCRGDRRGVYHLLVNNQTRCTGSYRTIKGVYDSLSCRYCT